MIGVEQSSAMLVEKRLCLFTRHFQGLYGSSGCSVPGEILSKCIFHSHLVNPPCCPMSDTKASLPAGVASFLQSLRLCSPEPSRMLLVRQCSSSTGVPCLRVSLGSH